MVRPHSGLLGFNGELFERLTGHYLLGHGYRAYNPVLLRFLQPDSWSPFGAGGLNPYCYCVGDPVNYSDPTGHIAFGLLKRLRDRGTPLGGMVSRPVAAQEIVRPMAAVSGVPRAGKRTYNQAFGPDSPHLRAEAVHQPLTGREGTLRPGPSFPASSGFSRQSVAPLPQSAVTENALADTVRDMLAKQDTAGLYKLAGESKNRAKTLHELFKQLPLSTAMKGSYKELEKARPRLLGKQLQHLVAATRAAGKDVDARFYDSLHAIFYMPRRAESAPRIIN